MNAEQAQGLLKFFIPTLESEFATTKKVIAAVPQATCEYKPDAKSKTGRELAWHIAMVEVFFIDGILSGKFDMSGEEPAVPATLEEISKWYDTTYSERLAQLKSASPEQLTRVIPFFAGMEMPAVAYLQFLVLHSAHHRGQLSAYLRSMGSKVPSIYGGSADEPFDMAAAQA
jgi:uncharacterized damage-inducible protein DinB